MDFASLPKAYEHWARDEGKCDVILEDMVEAESIGARILKAMIPSESEVFDDKRGLHSKAAEYLRRGIEERCEGARPMEGSFGFKSEDTDRRDRRPGPIIGRRVPSTLEHPSYQSNRVNLFTGRFEPSVNYQDPC